jgi:phage-related holin
MANCMVKLLGGIDKYLSALIVFITINYITEILLAIVGEERYSKMFLFKNIPESVKLIVFICQSTIRLAKSKKCTLIMLNQSA